MVGHSLAKARRAKTPHLELEPNEDTVVDRTPSERTPASSLPVGSKPVAVEVWKVLFLT